VASPEIDTVLEWRGRTVRDRAGEKIGTFEEIYLDADTDLPEWGGVRTGLLGTKQTLIPLADAASTGDDLQVPFDKELVERAPSFDPDAEPSSAEQAALYEHYAKGRSQTDPARAQPCGDAPAEDDAMTRSEEEVAIGTRARPRERVRLKKYVVTEHVTKTVPVQREEIRVERVPVDEQDPDGPSSS
jgi:hypothetical protein